MKTLTETKTTIDFDIDNCESEAVIENRVIKSTRIHLKGDQDNSFISNDEQFIRDVHKALSGLISHLDKERGFVVEGPKTTINGFLKGNDQTQLIGMKDIPEEMIEQNKKMQSRELKRDIEGTSILKEISNFMSSGHDSIQ